MLFLEINFEGGLKQLGLRHTQESHLHPCPAWRKYRVVPSESCSLEAVLYLLGRSNANNESVELAMEVGCLARVVDVVKTV